MKTLLRLVVLSLLVVACADTNKIASVGNPYELYVVSSDVVWNSAVGDTLKAIFDEPIEMLNQDEPRFDMTNVVPSALQTTLSRHRNLLILNVDSVKYTRSQIEARYDAYATNQLVVDVYAPSADSMANYLWDNRETLLRFFEKTEQDRFADRARKFSNSQISDLISSKFGFTMAVPKGYRVRDDKPGFLWISNELPLASQGIIIYSHRLADDSTSLIKERNLAVAQIPGPSVGSYMRTDTTFSPTLRKLTVKGHMWFEMRGFWSVANDFMGGPFVNFTTYNSAKDEMVSIDLYVSSPSPRHGKRNYVKQLEAIAMTAEFPTDSIK